MKTILAIDPGVSGGYAVLRDWLPNRYGRDAHSMPATEGDILAAFRALMKQTLITDPCNPQTIAVVEAQAGWAGKKKIALGRMFRFGRHYGFLLGALQAIGWRVELVPARTWQKALGLGGRTGTPREWKNKLKAEAQRRFPELNVTLATADALLILDYSVQKTRGENER